MTTPMGQWSFPTNMVFGAGSIDRLSEQVTACGGSHVLVVTDGGLAKTPVVESVTEALEAGGVPWTLFDGVHPNPIELDIEAGVTAYHGANADCIVGVGGGSPLDAAKLIALMSTHEGPIDQYDDARGGSERILPTVAPVIAVPTTAGTGSEVGRSGVVVSRTTGLKTVIFSPHLMPRVALCDPNLTLGLPPFLTAATGMDALTHNIEAYLAVGYHPFADAIALQGIDLCAQFLHRATRDGASDVDARAGMMVAASMGATAFQKGLGVCHSLAHPLSTVAGIHHGHANALMLGSVLDFNRDAAPDKIHWIGLLMGANEGEPAGDCVRRWVRELGLPATLTEAGVGEEHLEALVEQAELDGCKDSNPRSVSRADLEALYRSCF